MRSILVTGWRPGFKTISFMKLLREGSQSERSLPQAKALIDGLLEGQSFQINFENEEEAERFMGLAGELGAVSSYKTNS